MHPLPSLNFPDKRNIMYKVLIFFILFIVRVLPTVVFAEVISTEGEDAKKRYTMEKDKAQVLAQKGKEFILRSRNKEISKPTTMTVKQGEQFYIINEEDSFVHNVYDMTDSSWIIKKQHPRDVAAIIFKSPGIHNLRCAIHPKMKIKVEVVK